MYTTKLLAIMDDVMPRRHQIILAAIVVFVTVGSALTTIADRLDQRPAPAPPIVIVATATPAPARGLVKAAAPLVMRAAPTAAPAPPTAPEQVQVVVQPVRHVGERRSDKRGPGEH